jgi:hypothetical protein
LYTHVSLIGFDGGLCFQFQGENAGLVSEHVSCSVSEKANQQEGQPPQLTQLDEMRREPDLGPTEHELFGYCGRNGQPVLRACPTPKFVDDGNALMCNVTGKSASVLITSGLGPLTSE